MSQPSTPTALDIAQNDLARSPATTTPARSAHSIRRTSHIDMVRTGATTQDGVALAGTARDTLGQNDRAERKDCFRCVPRECTVGKVVSGLKSYQRQPRYLLLYGCGSPGGTTPVAATWSAKLGRALVAASESPPFFLRHGDGKLR